MRRANAFLSVYTADNSGMCSALYELGGLVIMHDASGCNSTYTTHDEPRWFDKASMVYISGLTEVDAVLGNEERLIQNICEVAKQYSPKFIALGGTPIPMMMGCDYDGIAQEVEFRTQIPCFGLDTNGTKDYVSGTSQAFRKLAERFSITRHSKTDSSTISVNILGLTPLDFSINGNAEQIQQILRYKGFDVISTFAMGSSLADIQKAGNADVNLVVTASGLEVAHYFYEKFQIPFVVGCPIGHWMTQQVTEQLKIAYKEKVNINLTTDGKEDTDASNYKVYIIGEPVIATSTRCALTHDHQISNVRVLTSLQVDPCLLTKNDQARCSEDDYLENLKGAQLVLADPIYRLVTKDTNSFVDWPHEAYSGRIWRSNIPIFIGDSFNKWFEQRKERAPLI